MILFCDTIRANVIPFPERKETLCRHPFPSRTKKLKSTRQGNRSYKINQKKK
jgi:hypothetical protein